MPFYEVVVPQETLTRDQRTKIAAEITHIHCDETGAPRSFVHVQYTEYPRDHQYTGGEPDNSLLMVFCNIREGRSLAERQRLVKRISGRLSEVLQKPEGELILTVNEINASTAMEFGLILPLPGGEAEWFDKHSAVLKNHMSIN